MTVTESRPNNQQASMTPLERLLVEVSTNTKSLRAVSMDPVQAFRAAGASDFAVNCLSMQRGSWISLALSTSQPIPTQEAIDSFLAKRVREDSFFADRLRTEPRRILERSFSTRFPGGATFEVIELDGYPTVLVKGVVPGAINSNDLSPHADTEVDTDTDVDVDVDTDIDIDAISDVDVDTDIDVDIDTVVDSDNSLVGVAGTADSRLKTLHDQRWSDFWARHEAMWASRDDRRVS
jgi:hypothetical protein